jgi:hypothetical protein
MTKKLTGVRSPKSARKSDAKKPALIPQKHGGALASGGTPGHRGAGGRPSNDELKWLKKIITGPRMRRSLRKIVRTGRDEAKLQLFKLGADRVYGAPNQKIDTTVTLAELLGEGEDT